MRVSSVILVLKSPILNSHYLGKRDLLHLPHFLMEHIKTRLSTIALLNAGCLIYSLIVSITVSTIVLGKIFYNSNYMVYSLVLSSKQLGRPNQDLCRFCMFLVRFRVANYSFGLRFSFLSRNVAVSPTFPFILGQSVLRF